MGSWCLVTLIRATNNCRIDLPFAISDRSKTTSNACNGTSSSWKMSWRCLTFWTSSMEQMALVAAARCDGVTSMRYAVLIKDLRTLFNCLLFVSTQTLKLGGSHIGYVGLFSSLLFCVLILTTHNCFKTFTVPAKVAKDAFGHDLCSDKSCQVHNSSSLAPWLFSWRIQMLKCMGTKIVTHGWHNEPKCEEEGSFVNSLKFCEPAGYDSCTKKDILPFTAFIVWATFFTRERLLLSKCRKWQAFSFPFHTLLCAFFKFC